MTRKLAQATILMSVLALPAAAKRAPEFSIGRILNGPVSSVKGLGDLKGKVVYLEFWATWCGPCVAGIPRTNRLLDALKGEDVVFLFVTEEPEETVKKFLAKKEVKAWVGVDEELKAVGPYHALHRRPDGFLIGKDGSLLARVYPDMLTEKDVRRALAGKFAAKPVTWQTDRMMTKAEAPAGGSLLELSISTCDGKEMSSMAGYGVAEAKGFLAWTIASLWDVDQRQVILDTEPVKCLGYRLKAPWAGDGAHKATLRAAVQEALSVRVQEDSPEMDAFALTVSSAALLPAVRDEEIQHGYGVYNCGGGRLNGSDTMAAYAKCLTMIMDTPVLDETGLAGRYDLDLEWPKDQKGGPEAALGGHGLRLEPARRNVRTVRVSPR